MYLQTKLFLFYESINLLPRRTRNVQIEVLVTTKIVSLGLFKIDRKINS